MSNTFASIDAAVDPAKKMLKCTPCESFNPKATVSKWSKQYICVTNGIVAHGGSGAIATLRAAAGKGAPEYGLQCFEVMNCFLRKVEEFNGPPIRSNVLCFTCALDRQVKSAVFEC